METIKRLDRIERKRRTLLAGVVALHPRVLNARPRPDAWSIAEIIEHLVLAENTVIGDFSALDELPEQPRGLRDRMLYPVAMFVLRFHIPVKAPSRAMVPTGTWSLADAVTTWEGHHRALRIYIEGLDRKGLRRPVFRHPVTGPLSVSQGIAMLEVHLDTHILQIRERAQTLSFPGDASSVNRREGA